MIGALRDVPISDKRKHRNSLCLPLWASQKVTLLKSLMRRFINEIKKKTVLKTTVFCYQRFDLYWIFFRESVFTDYLNVLGIFVLIPLRIFSELKNNVENSIRIMQEFSEDGFQNFFRFFFPRIVVRFLWEYRH